MKRFCRLLLSIIFLSFTTLHSQTVTFSKPRGFYTNAFNLTLTTNVPGATIKYTIVGTPPSATVGTNYTGPFTVKTSTVVRAVAVVGNTSTRVFTNTYIFPAKVIAQPYSPSGWKKSMYDLGNGNAQALQDYAMDTNVVNNPLYSADIIPGLRAIPTMSIGVDKAYFWQVYDEKEGATANTQASVSVEIIYPDNTYPNEQFDCTLEAHSHKRLKRSLRLDVGSGAETKLFRSAPLNGSSARDKFKDTKIVLRGGNNDCWARNWNPDGTTYIRDEWYRASGIAMNGTGAHGTFVHLYIDGMYWGLYNPVERLDEGFITKYFGGDISDWLTMSQDGIKSGDPSRYTYLVGTLTGRNMAVPANYEELKRYLDVSNFADYMIVTWMPGMDDWPGNNYFGANRNNPAEPFFYVPWDCEWSWTTKHGSNNGAWVCPAFDSTAIPGVLALPAIWKAAKANPDFMAQFADRVYKNCFNGGAMTDANSIARWQKLRDYISTAIIAESARWGDAVGDSVLRTKNTHWLPEVNRIEGLMNGNVARFIAALRAQKYYPTIDPPNFNHEEGHVAKGFQLTMTNPNGVGTIYYTMNGSDPRMPGGGLLPAAILYSGAITINDHTIIKARIKNGNEWSALHEGLFAVYDITIIEFLTNNVSNITDEAGDHEDWIEIFNNTPLPFDLSGMYLTNSFATPKMFQVTATNSAATTIPPYGFKLLIADNELSEGLLHTNFKLAPTGGQIGLYMPNGVGVKALDSLVYAVQTTDVSRGRYTDGTNNFITFNNPTPGDPNLLPATGLFINEFLASNSSNITDEAGQHDDWIEIYNDNTTPVNIGGFYLTDNLTVLNKFRIPVNAPAATTIPAKGFIVLWADNDPEQGPLHLDIKLNISGNQIGLVQMMGAPRFVDSLRYGAQITNVSRGRYPDGNNAWRSFGSPTPGQPNVIGLVAGLSINEWMSTNTTTSDEFGDKDDWIEIFNSNSDTVDIGGLYITNNLLVPSLYQIPLNKPQSTKIVTGGFKRLWADNQASQGALHVGFTLSATEKIGLAQSYNGVVFLDTVAYASQSQNKSIGRFPDGTGFKMTFNTPTPAASNTLPAITGVYINEFLSSNTKDTTDESGSHDDWIEFYNSTSSAVNLAGMFITDDLTDPRKFQLSASSNVKTTIPANGFLLFWADGQSSQGSNHLDIKLSAGGEQIGLVQPQGSNNIFIDSLTFGTQNANVSEGRYPDGAANLIFFNSTTPGKSNVVGGTGAVDCNGVTNGTAALDACGVCSGGNTGKVPNINKDCNGVCFGTAVKDDCGICTGGNTGKVADANKDCNGVCNGSATIDACGVCAGGNTGKVANATKDCNGVCNGTAAMDNCGVCAGGNTGKTPNATCAGGSCTLTVTSLTLVKTGTAGDIQTMQNGDVINLAVTPDVNVRANPCANDVKSVKFVLNGSTVRTETSLPFSLAGDNSGSYLKWSVTPGSYTLAVTPYSGVSATGTAGVAKTVSFTVVNQPVGGTVDCNGVAGGTATIDACGVCAGGNTGKVANATKDCNGVCNGTATLDACGVCTGGNTGKVANASKDCNGVCNGTAAIDACGVCAGGNTGKVANATKDCNGVCNGTAAVDNCGVCAGGNTGKTPNATCSGGSCTLTVSSLTLVKTGTAGDIKELVNGDIINLATTPDINVRANPCASDVKSVKFVLNGSAIRTETSLPFALAGDNSGSYLKWSVTPGSYTLAVTPYSGVSATGTAGVAKTVSFTVVSQSTAGTVDCNGVTNGTAALDDCGLCAGGNTGKIANATKDCNGVCNGTAVIDACGICAGGNTGKLANATKDCNGVCNGTAYFDECKVCVGGNTGKLPNANKDACGICFGNGSTCGGGCPSLTVISLTLVKTGTAGDIKVLQDGDVINLAVNPGVNVRADVCNTDVKSVKFILNGTLYRTESTMPFSLAGDNVGSFTKWSVTPGSYTLTATPYSTTNATGTPGTGRTVSFTVVNAAAKMDGEDIDSEKSFTFSLYPNPSDGSFTVEGYNDTKADVALRVYNALGQVIFKSSEKRISGKFSQPVSIQSVPGIYYVEMMRGHEMKIDKMVVR